MATVKKFNTSYTLDGPQVTVTGNLNIIGSQTAISTTNTTIKDNIIILNDGETGSGVTLGSAGVLVDRGLAANVQMRWYEPYQKWQVTNDGTTYANISSSTSITGNLSLHDDANPYLMANLNLHGYTIVSNVGNMYFDGNLQINNASSSPPAVSGATVVYAAEPGAGTSGIYVVNGQAANEELITKRRSFGFSLLL